MTEADAALTGSDKVGFRDIYRAVGESETRIKEHISLALIPFATQLTDHERRITKAEASIVILEATDANAASANGERRRIGGLTNKALGLIVLLTNFIVGTLVVVSNLMTSHQPS